MINLDTRSARTDARTKCVKCETYFLDKNLLSTPTENSECLHNILRKHKLRKAKA